MRTVTRSPGRVAAHAMALGCLALGLHVSVAAGADGPDRPPLTPGESYTFRDYRSGDYVVSSSSQVRLAQLRLAMQRQQRALIILSEGAISPEAVDTARWLIDDGHVLVRTAEQGVRRSQTLAKYPDPLLRLQLDGLEQVRGHLLPALVELERVRGADGKVGTVIDHLEQAIVHLDALIVVIP